MEMKITAAQYGFKGEVPKRALPLVLIINLVDKMGTSNQQTSS